MREFEKLEFLENFIANKEIIKDIAMQSLDLTMLNKQFSEIEFKNCIFLGCTLTDNQHQKWFKNNYIFPKLDVPYNTYPKSLYTTKELYNDYDFRHPESYQQTFDNTVYQHYLKEGKVATNIKETLARRLHDHSITDALYDFLSNYDEKKVVAIMGGHSLSRTDEMYFLIAEISKILTELGYLMISGGGPGAMEATHLGAWMAGKKIEDLTHAIKILSVAPHYNHPQWLPTAFEVLEQYPTSQYVSLGVPTWLYGHEPSTPFATYIAKYFANSVREDGLLTIAKGGVIYTPGSAGTMQEIFQDITQNHYVSFGYASPMVFVGKEYWSNQRPIYPMIELMSLRGNLLNLNMGIYDTKEEIIGHIESFTDNEKNIKTH